MLSALFFSSFLCFLPPDEAFFRAVCEKKEVLTDLYCMYGYGTRIRYSGIREHRKKRNTPVLHSGAPYFLPDGKFSDAGLFRRLRKDAENLSVPAMRILAFCYITGRGTERNPAAALAWWRKAARLGDPVSIRYLAETESSEKYHEQLKRMKSATGELGFLLYLPELTGDPDKAELILMKEESIQDFLIRAVEYWMRKNSAVILIPEW